MLRLCTIDGRQVDLEGGETYVLGRSADCDVVVEDRASSRRHARIEVGTMDHVASIADLKSRNGTYLNDQRVRKATQLQAGDRIRIGATLCLVVKADDDEPEDEDAPLIDTKTRAMEHLGLDMPVSTEILRVVRKDGETAPEFAGQLGAMNVVDLLQMLVQTNRSGTVHLALESGEARVEIRQGEIVSALFSDLTGIPALQMLARLRKGLFWLVESEAACTRTVRVPTTVLLLELCSTLQTAEES